MVVLRIKARSYQSKDENQQLLFGAFSVIRGLLLVHHTWASVRI
jgi:hypothetical protein